MFVSFQDKPTCFTPALRLFFFGGAAGCLVDVTFLALLIAEVSENLSNICLRAI